MQSRNIDYSISVGLYQSSREAGDIIKSPRRFGVEFELVPDINKKGYNPSVDVEKIHNATERMMPDGWGATRDGSVEVLGGGGVEIQTPPMRLIAGEKEITNFCKSVKKIGWGVNDPCGLHVHIDAKDISDSPLLSKRVFTTYFVLDYSILAMLPEDRRSNVFCAPLDKKKARTLLRWSQRVYNKGFDIDDVIATKATKTSFLEMFYKSEISNVPREIATHYNEARYHGINFHNLFGRTKTIEIRYLEGTIDYDLILKWTAFHQHIIDSSSNIREIDALELYKIKGPKTRLRKFAEMTNMPKYLLDFACERIDKFKN
jgi:hypothetical protein